VDTTGQTELTALRRRGQTREQISEGVAISWMRRDMSLDVAGNRLPRYQGRIINDLAFEDRAEDKQPMIAGAAFDSASRFSIRRTFSFNAAICCCSAAFFCSSVLRMGMRLLSFSARHTAHNSPHIIRRCGGLDRRGQGGWISQA
jgi:hypothetical protein